MTRVIVIGGANVVVKGRTREAFIAGTSNPADVVITPGGVSRNIAENLARLGLDAALTAFVGDDANGRLIRDSCAVAGVDTAMIETCAATTGVYLAILDEGGELVAAVNDMRAADLVTVDYLRARSDRFAAADYLIADCNLPTLCLDWLCHFATEIKVPLLIEPISTPKAMKLLDFARPSPVFAITPNLQQLEALTGERHTLSAVTMLHQLGFANIVVHCGKEGAIVSDGVTPAKRLLALPSTAVADVTGAGDAAVAGLVCGLAAGHDFAVSARLGQAAASIKLGSRNSAAPGISRDSVFALAGMA